MDIISFSRHFSFLATGNVCDADKENVKVMDSSIKALDTSMKCAGPAYTVECTGGNNLAIHQAITLAPAGSILVVNVHGSMASGHFGDIMATACQQKGILGLVIDGACRDIEDLIKMRFPVFARGSMPHTNGKINEGLFNQPIVCGGINVTANDMIFADASGVTVFPKQEAQAIIEKATAIAIKEMDIVKMLYEGKTTMEIYGLKNI